MLVLKGFDPEDVGTMIKLVREAFGKDYSRDLFLRWVPSFQKSL